MLNIKALEREIHAKQFPQSEPVKNTAGQVDEGWPTDRGPLPDLVRLGFHHGVNWRPKWASWPRVRHLHGRIQYTASSKTLHADAIRALAALTFEGYDVRLSAVTADKLIIDITPQEVTND